jgi:hypothetical protein
VFVSTTSTGDPALLTRNQRDASDRVAQIRTADGALQLLEQAERVGDEVLARAVAQTAYDHDWTDVANKFLDSRQDLAEPLNELWHLPSDADKAQQKVALSMALSTLRPPELQGVYDAELGSLAASADAAE